MRIRFSGIVYTTSSLLAENFGVLRRLAEPQRDGNLTIGRELLILSSCVMSTKHGMF